MAVYGLDIAVAGLLGAAFSVPGSAFRAFGGWLSDRIGAGRVMYTTFIACIAITFQIGRASCRESMCQYVWISVVAVSLNKNTRAILSYNGNDGGNDNTAYINND